MRVTRAKIAVLRGLTTKMRLEEMRVEMNQISNLWSVHEWCGYSDEDLPGPVRRYWKLKRDWRTLLYT